MAAKKADKADDETVATLANIGTDKAEAEADEEPVKLMMPTGTVVHARPEVAERLVANGASAPKAKRKTAADKED